MKEGWITRKFSDIFDLQMGKTPSRDNSSYWGGTNTWVSIADMNCGKYIYDTKEHITNSAVSESGIYRVSKDTVIMSFKLSIGKTAIATKDLYTNEAIMSFNTKEGFEILPDYIYYYLKGYKWQGINKAVMGMTLNKKAISNNIFSYPNTLQQQHIVEELDLLSSIIEKKKAQIKELDNLAQSLFYEMFGDPITNEKGWSYKKLNTLIDENVITYHLDGNHGGDYPRSEEFVDEGVPYIGANSLNNGFVNFSMAKYLPKERAAKLKKGLAINGDVLFAHNATVGPVAYLITNEPLVILSTSLTAYRCNQDKMNPLFLRAYMQSIWFESQYKASMKQTTRNQIPITQQKKFDFILPPISLQNQFAEKIKVIEHQKELINQSIKEVETLFNSRMDYYFN